MSGYLLHNFGCRASAADGDAIGAALEREGGLDRATLSTAEVVVVNTCAVTAEAERSARAMLRRVRRENPSARVVVTGCYAQRAPEELRGLADAVVGNSHKGEVARVALGGSVGFVPLALVGSRAEASLLHASFPQGAFLGEMDAGGLLPFAGAFRTRPNLKVQDGCGNRCSFCVIPETRGPSRSVPLGEALGSARAFAAEGGQELVLSGINLGRWGRDLRPARRLDELVRALIEETPLARLRISSVEPMDWTPELLSLVGRYGAGEHPRLAPHAHLPLQSGADAVLRHMHRRYRPWHYAEKVRALRGLLPDAAIGADVMVGFPGETEALFRESYALIEKLPLTYLHLFPFSARPGTAAEKRHRDDPVQPGAVRERMRALEALGAAKRRAFAESFVGRAISCVTLRDGTALAANYLPVVLRATVPANRLLAIPVASWERDKLVSEGPGGWSEIRI